MVYSMLNSEISTREFALVGSKEMPEEDFEKLTWKISVMKHLQDIKKEHPDTEKEANGNGSSKKSSSSKTTPKTSASTAKKPGSSETKSS